MSEKEKQFVELVSKLPEKCQDKFLDQAKGAVLALDTLSATAKTDHDDGAEAS